MIADITPRRTKTEAIFGGTCTVGRLTSRTEKDKLARVVPEGRIILNITATRGFRGVIPCLN